MIAGVAMAAEGIFPCDPGCPDNPTTLTGRIHSPIATLILAFSWLLAPIFLGFRMRKDPRWRGHSLYSFLTVIVFFALFLLARPVLEPSLGRGVTQRLVLVLPIPLWIFVTGIRLYRLATATEGAY